jgi:carbamoyl-phosphate synthase large subunit
MFSFMRLEGADPILGVEMMSTGEVACIGDDFPDALVKSMIGAELNIPLENGNILISVAGTELKQKIVPIALKMQEMGYKIFATQHTADVLVQNGIQAMILHKVSEEDKKPNIKDYILQRKLQMVINIPYRTQHSMADITRHRFSNIKSRSTPLLPESTIANGQDISESLDQSLEDEYLIRRKAVEFNIPVITNLQVAESIVEAIQDLRDEGIFDWKTYYERVKILSLNEYQQLLKDVYW